MNQKGHHLVLLTSCLKRFVDLHDYDMITGKLQERFAPNTIVRRNILSTVGKV